MDQETVNDLVAQGNASMGRCDGWQLIETAPKDGTRVLVYVPPYGAMTGHNNFHLFGGTDKDEWQCHSCLSKEAQPTHWMPLPKPPVT